MTISASRALAATAAAVLLHCVTPGSVRADDDHELRADQRASIGFEIAKTQNIALDPNVPSQGLGSYLVTVSSCNDCHSQPNFAPGGILTAASRSRLTFRPTWQVDARSRYRQEPVQRTSRLHRRPASRQVSREPSSST